MRYPPALQRRLHTLAVSLAAEGVAWDPAESGLIRVRPDARPSFGTEHAVRSLLCDLRRWYYGASCEWTGVFVAETRNLAQSCDRQSPIERDTALTLMALASRADKAGRRLVEERVLIVGSIEDEPVVPEIGVADDLPTAPDAKDVESGDWRKAERDLLALLRLQLALETGGLDVQAQQEIAGSLWLLRRAVQTWQETSAKPRSTPLTFKHVRTAVREVEGADEETKKRKAAEVVLDVMAEMARRVARSEELSPYADADLLQGAMEDMGDLVWRMRGMAGIGIALAEVDFAQVLATWQQSDDPELLAAATELDIRLAGWERDPEAAQAEWRRCQKGAPPEPVGWRDAVRHLAEQLADAGILWHPRSDTIRHHPGACLPGGLARDVAILLARLRAWHFQAATDDEMSAFATEMRMQAGAWRDVWRQTGEIEWREGAAELERMALRAELLGCRLPESWEWLRGSLTGHWPIVQPSNALPDPSQRLEQPMTIQDAYTGLWRLATALRRGAIRTTNKAPVEVP